MAEVDNTVFSINPKKDRWQKKNLLAIVASSEGSDMQWTSKQRI